MNRLIVFSVILACMTGSAFAEDGATADPLDKPIEISKSATLTKPAPDDGRVRLSIQPWLSTGESEFEISFLVLGPGFSVAEVGSLLEWEDLDSEILYLRGELDINDWLTFGGGMGSGDIEDGRNTDTDTINGTTFLESQADADGDITAFDAALYVDIFELIKKRPAGLDVDVFAGFQYYKEEIRDFNGVSTVFLGMPENVPFDGLNSTFDFEWRAIRLGGRADYPLWKRLHVKGQAALLAGVDYEGEGFWNLRDDFRRTSPNFEQEGDGGTGYDVRVALAFEVIKHVTIEAGYWVMGFEVEDGEDRVFFADGSVEETNLDHAESTRHGFYAGVTGYF